MYCSLTVSPVRKQIKVSINLQAEEMKTKTEFHSRLYTYLFWDSSVNLISLLDGEDPKNRNWIIFPYPTRLDNARQLVDTWEMFVDMTLLSNVYVCVYIPLLRNRIMSHHIGIWKFPSNCYFPINPCGNFTIFKSFCFLICFWAHL